MNQKPYEETTKTHTSSQKKSRAASNNSTFFSQTCTFGSIKTTSILWKEKTNFVFFHLIQKPSTCMNLAHQIYYIKKPSECINKIK